jgi:hypothetical protein
MTSFCRPYPTCAFARFSLENLDEDLEYCLHRVSFVFAFTFFAAVVVLIDFLFPRR